MADAMQSITVKLSEDLASRLARAADRTGREKDEIISTALTEWLAEDQRRHDLTLEGLEDVDQGRTISQEEILDWAEQRKQQRRQAGDLESGG